MAVELDEIGLQSVISILGNGCARSSFQEKRNSDSWAPHVSNYNVGRIKKHAKSALAYELQQIFSSQYCDEAVAYETFLPP